MIIKEIRISNFRSYYGDNNKFSFNDGLTLVLGENGDGKTAFFEAIQWLFNTTADKGYLYEMSEMKKTELDVGEQGKVSVFASFNHNGEKSVEKTFVVEKISEENYRIGAINYYGYEIRGSERMPVNGKNLIDRCYDAFIQRFSMFKGEAELDVFDNPTALRDLVDKFSDIHKFDDFVEYTSSFTRSAERAFMKEAQTDRKIADKIKYLDQEINSLSNAKSDLLTQIKEKEKSVEFYSTKLGELEGHQETSEKYKELQRRLKTQEEKRNRLKGQILSVDYNHALLDKYWILCAYPKILQEFKQKCAQFSKEKRHQENEFIKQKAIELGKLEAVQEIQAKLSNGSERLPWYLPDQETMEEMIHDHICKICGRPAEEGSPAYLFMVNKLEEYKHEIAKKTEREKREIEIKEEKLFLYDNIETLHNLSISLSGVNESIVVGKASEIKDRIELVERLTNDLKDVEQKIQEVTDEKTRLLIQAGNVSEEVLEKEFNDIKGLYEQRDQNNIRLAELNKELGFKQKQLDDFRKQRDELNPESLQVKLYKNVHLTLQHIASAFTHARKENLRRFLDELQDKSNIYLEKLSANDFHGEIHLSHHDTNNSTEIKLLSSNGTEIKKPSGSQRTVMYISVLFAISDFTQEKRDEDYPLIFDAATSSFGDTKEKDFYNVIDKLHKQCIILTKDFIDKDKKIKMGEIEQLTCTVYRIQKKEGFDQNNLASVRTLIKKIK